MLLKVNIVRKDKIITYKNKVQLTYQHPVLKTDRMRSMKLSLRNNSQSESRRSRFVLMVVVLSMLITTVPLKAATTVTIIINDTVIAFTDNQGSPFIDTNSRTQVPFRVPLEFIGAKVTFDALTRTATAIKDDIRVDVPIGEKYIVRNGEKILNDTSSVILNNRTYLPIRIVLEAFGATVSWNQATSTVNVNYVEEENLFTRIPTKYDLRLLGKVTPVKNQFTTGACWAFASFGAIESLLLPNEIYDFSEDHLSLGHGFDLEQADGGNYAISLSYLTRWSGPVLEVDDVFNDGVNNPNAIPVKRIQEARFIPNKNYTDIKLSLMKYGALQTSIYLSDATIAANSAYYNAEKASYYYNGKEIINHDVVIVGWDDNYSKDNFKTKPLKNGAFIVKNSYGTAFGNQGYFYISYEDKHVGTQNIAFTRVDTTTKYTTIYQSDWLGYIGQIGYGEDTAYFSNVYEAKVQEDLKAVAFYATGENTNYEVYVVPQFKSSVDFSKMKLVKRGHLDFAGYYTIDFETPEVVLGTFAVVVKITTPNSRYPVAAEFMKSLSWLKTVDITDGIGYMSYDGLLWERTETELESNVCLKAFTVKRGE